MSLLNHRRGCRQQKHRLYREPDFACDYMFMPHDRNRQGLHPTNEKHLFVGSAGQVAWQNQRNFPCFRHRKLLMRDPKVGKQSQRVRRELRDLPALLRSGFGSSSSSSGSPRWRSVERREGFGDTRFIPFFACLSVKAATLKKHTTADRR